MGKARILTGITTTGTPHLGNYVGAIRPAIRESQTGKVDAFILWPTSMPLIKAKTLPPYTNPAKKLPPLGWPWVWIPTRQLFYRQSDIPEIPQLMDFKLRLRQGLMNRAHAYKAAVDANVAEGEDLTKPLPWGCLIIPC